MAAIITEGTVPAWGLTSPPAGGAMTRSYSLSCYQF